MAPVGAFTIWLLFFPLSIIQMILSKERMLDKIFKPGKYSYKLVMERIAHLEEYTGLYLKTARKRVDYYLDNSKQTRRKFSYYISIIEPGFLRILLAHQAKDKSFIQGHTNSLFRWHFYFIAIFPIGFALCTIPILFFHPSIASLFLFIIAAPLAYIIFKFLGSSTLLFYHIIDMLFFQSKGRGILTRNVNVIHPILKDNFGFSRTGIVIGAAGAASFYSGSGISGIGFGGGSFGGGGAGGSW